MYKFGVGQALTRIEDKRLLTGQGHFTDDEIEAGQVCAYFLRSPHAHAAIDRIDVAAARALPGVLGVFTAADADAAGLGTIKPVIKTKNRDGSNNVEPDWPLLARGSVRHVGNLVAMVVATNEAQARDAADAIVVGYRALPAAVELSAAVAPGAPQVWPEAPGNICFDWIHGDEAKTQAAFASGAHRVEVELVNNRVVSNPIEPRAALVRHDAAADRYTLHVASQGVHNIRDRMAGALGVKPEQIRVLTGDVGGGFGTKIFVYPEYVLACWAAKKLGRPIKWTSDRSHAFVTDVHGRDNLAKGELALDREGKILAMRATILANMGAYLSNFAPLIPAGSPAGMFTGVYAIPAAFINVKAVFTHTVPVDAYRGAGRPEASYLIERLVDAAARQIGLDPGEIRRRNFIPPAAFPFTNSLGKKFDSGEFARNMDQARSTVDWAGLARRKAQAKARGKLLGLGLSYYIEVCAFAGTEIAHAEFEGETVAVWVGTQNNGQGHETSFAQVAAERFGIPIERIRIRFGDSDRIPKGGGTGGSRSMALGGHAVGDAAVAIIDKAKAVAGELLEVATADLAYAEGAFTVVGTDRRVDLFQVAAEATRRGAALVADVTYKQTDATFPNGCHVAEVEIDPETGALRVVRYVAVDDFGRVVNPLLLAGQVHGGIAQGLGQALIEHAVYDHASGQLLSGSMMDYAMPMAELLPPIEFAWNEVPCRTNPLGVKGAGEAGSIGAPAAVINAILDALAPYGVTAIDMPATPEKIWRALGRR
ncbi:MAG: xanthine dehydrogenase family protein molybdopterin-binding subunit [Alphaproteobacteria bacterium]|nr:xanthine dehydrogenase family protein molybdopterin-binding subunit [Alphaproteobacteria bacterium]